MSDGERITSLIRELQDLHVQEAALLQELDIAIRRRESDGPKKERTMNGDTAAGTQLRYQLGDRIYVTNRVRRPVFAPQDWTLLKERRATVTRVDRDKIHYRTDNGT